MNLSLILYYLTVLSIDAFAKRRRIIGGENASVRDTPYAAALVFPEFENFLCSACIISNRHALTAAHCLYHGEHYYDSVRLYAGFSDINTDVPSVYKLEKVHVHPEYTGEVTEQSMSTHDIAIIVVEGVIHFDEFQNKIDLPTSDYFPSRNAVISGFGMTKYPSNQKYSHLQQAAVKILSQYICEEYFDFPIRSDQLCTLQTEGVGVCVGDSGGPVTVHGKLIGIISFNAPCARGIPDVHTNIFRFLDFIRSHMND